MGRCCLTFLNFTIIIVILFAWYAVFDTFLRLVYPFHRLRVCAHAMSIYADIYITETTAGKNQVAKSHTVQVESISFYVLFVSYLFRSTRPISINHPALLQETCALSLKEDQQSDRLQHIHL